MRLTKRILCTAVILLNVAAFIGCGGTKTVEGEKKKRLRRNRRQPRMTFIL